MLKCQDEAKVENFSVSQFSIAIEGFIFLYKYSVLLKHLYYIAEAEALLVNEKDSFTLGR